MISIDEMEDMLNEIVERFPEGLFKDLNGGILLLPQKKENEQSLDRDLFILGEYHRGGPMGRYITIYYGSFMKVYGNMSRSGIKKRLKDTLKHEFVHHLESLAGERDLEIEDREFMEKYFEGKRK
ncbi:metallopeptidase family protein [Alkalibacter saccharofermentans]|uniref:Zinicin-like metallopeptidase n=1 Tax=Alkalibacter saccharofermentans DSM 14828 TaxID=1120975 RepID=A0A1M4X3Z1_9FIRM|nr:metallopeptidase family protein [Alkalibacter saccharofermentans]SHE88160.1 hypothetical protein SAMN02746064_01414 [Alkalibacter saccharofermentans DSM 14828]